MKRIFLFIIPWSLITLHAVGQVNTDSLRRVISSRKDNQQKIPVLINLCEQFRFANPDSLLAAARELKQIGKQANDVSVLSYAEYFIAMYYGLSGNSDTAYLIATKNIAAMEKQNSNSLLLIKLYGLAGNCLMRMNRQKDALQIFYSALQKAENANDDEDELKAFNNIGWAYMELEQFQKAIVNFKKALAVISQNIDLDRYPTIYNNIASCYGSLTAYDSVYQYARTGIRVAEKVNDYAALANSYSIMGTFLSKQEHNEQALDNFSKAVAIREKTADPFFIVSDLAEIAELQSKTKNSSAGIETGLKALNIAIQNNITAKLPLIYTALADNYEKTGNYSEAVAVYKKLNMLKDSLYTDANPKALAEIQTKYETVKQEQKLQQQENRMHLQNVLFLGIAGLLLLTGLLGYSQYKKNKLRKEAKQKTELMIQQEMAVKAVMEAEENERQRIAKDLHDSVGQMMSAAKMNLSAFESEIHFANNEQRMSLQKIIELIDESCKEVRTVSHIMMPNALLKNNLASAINDFAVKLSNKSLLVHVNTAGLNERLDSNVETVLYRVVQECVNNVIKHADASTLDISLFCDKEGISATIEDNGRGFDMAAGAQSGGIGLKNILTRIGYLKGTVDFHSKPGQGTLVVLHIPIKV